MNKFPLFVVALPMMVFAFTVTERASFAGAKIQAVQDVWTAPNGSDPNDERRNSAEIDPKLLKQLLAKLSEEEFSIKLEKIELSGRERFVFIRTSIPKENDTENTTFDQIGPVFDYAAGKLTEIKIPSFPCKYTNILLPAMELVKGGIKMNVHYAVAFTPTGKVNSTGSSAPSARDSIYGSAQCAVLWKGDSIRKIKENFICDGESCSPKTAQILKEIISKK